MAQIGIPDWRPDLSDLGAPFTGSVSNVYPRGDGYGPIPSLTQISTALGANCRGFFMGRNTDGTVAIFAGTATKLYQLNNTDTTWTDVSKSAGTYTTLAANAQWQFAQFNKYVIAVQANTAPQVFDLTSSTAFADLGGSPPAAAYIAIVNRFVVLSGLTNNPLRLQWSGLNAVTTWDNTTASSGYQDMPDGGPVRTIGAMGGDIGIITQDEAVRRMVFQPGSDVVFTIERVQAGRGILAPYSLTAVADKLFYLSPQGFVQSDVSGSPIPIGTEKIDRTFFAAYDSSSLQQIVAAGNPKGSMVYWAYKSLNGGSAGQFDALLIYNYVLQRWSPVTVSGQWMAVMARPGATLESLDSINSSIDALTASLDNYATSALPEIAVIDSSKKLAIFTGTPIEATLQTPEESNISSRNFLRGFFPVTDAPTVYGSTGYRATLNASVSYTTEVQMDTIRGFVPQRIDSRYMRAKLRIPAGTTWTFAGSVEPDFMQTGLR